MSRRLLFLLPLVLLLALAGCGSEATPTPTGPTSPPPTVASAVVPPCEITPIVPPTIPATEPGYVQLDTATNLHMTGTPQRLELASWRLAITGKVDRPVTLTFDELRCLPRVESDPRLVCPGFFQDDARWAGAPVGEVLQLAGVQSDARGLRLKSADGYTTPVTIEQALDSLSFLAYEWNGEPLPVLHGFPVRAVFGTLEGNSWVKWLIEIEVF